MARVIREQLEKYGNRDSRFKTLIYSDTFTKEELESKLNLLFWIISNGEFGSEVKIDYLRLEYSKNWMELIAIGAIVILSVVAFCVILNKDS